MDIKLFSTNHNLKIDPSQGSNLTFEDNSQMASTWSRFISHECVSTSPGTCAAQNSHFYVSNNSNMRKCKTAVAINCNKLYNITCILRGLVEKQFVFPLNSTKKSPTVQCFFRACDIWQQTALTSKLYVSQGKFISVQIFVLMKIELCYFQNHRFLS